MQPDNRPPTRSSDPQPEIPTPPGDMPKQFPGKTPISRDDAEPSKREAAGASRTGSGEDPLVESGLPENDPERPRETPGEQSMK